MPGAKLPSLPTIVLAIAFVGFVLDANGGPGWGAAAAHGVLAARMAHTAAAPLYDLLASVASLLPVGEVGFRLGVLAALLAALTLAGVVVAVRALVPRDLGASLIAVVLLAIAPPFRMAAALAAPAMLAACGTAWSFACAARYAREPRAREVAVALAGCAAVVGSAPWLGVALTAAIVGWLWRRGARDVLAISLGALGAFAVAWWLGAAGSLPGAIGNLTAAVAVSGRGAAAVVVGAGLLGVGFGALTGLAGARWLAVLVAIAAGHEIIVGASAPALLALLAIAAAIVPSAIVRAVKPDGDGIRRHALALGAGAPLVAIAAALGGTFSVEDPGAAPTALATDLVGSLPPGPGVFVTTRPTTLAAVQYEMVIAGARPDLTLVPPLPERQADAVVANALRGDEIAGADVAALGRLELLRALPRGRGFQLLGEVPTDVMPVAGPARYATRIGHEQAVMLAIERARYEAASGRLDLAARALGLESRFGAADLAVLAATQPSPERPALFGFLPLDTQPPGDWMLDVFGDDLAWVGGIPIPPVDDRAPLARRLHAKWRDVILGKLKPDDPSIAALGPRAVAATRELFAPAK